AHAERLEGGLDCTSKPVSEHLSSASVLSSPAGFLWRSVSFARAFQFRAVLYRFATFGIWNSVGRYLVALPRVSARQQFSRTPSFSAPKAMSCNPDGILWDGGSTELEWKSFIRLHETKRLLLLYTSPSFFQLVPKR